MLEFFTLTTSSCH